MCSDRKTTTYMTDCSAAAELLVRRISAARYVMIGAGAGLSASAGFDYSGDGFKKSFADFIEKYGLTDGYSGGFYPYATPEECWAFFSRLTYLNRYRDPPKNTYNLLYRLVKDKDYFVLTTNVDHCFQKAGFDKQRLFYTQGDYGLWQCSVPCHNGTYDNKDVVTEMVRRQKDCKVPGELVPFCPKCGAPMTTNLRCDDKFVEDDGWHAAARRYGEFAERTKNGKILYLELGVGYDTPGVIKYPFWRGTLENPGARFYSINANEPFVPPEIADRAVSVKGDIHSVLEKAVGASVL